jgi:hypothetical protein
MHQIWHKVLRPEINGLVGKKVRHTRLYVFYSIHNVILYYKDAKSVKIDVR